MPRQDCRTFLWSSGQWMIKTEVKAVQVEGLSEGEATALHSSFVWGKGWCVAAGRASAWVSSLGNYCSYLSSKTQGIFIVLPSH